jgi:hypothetical protein
LVAPLRRFADPFGAHRFGLQRLHPRRLGAMALTLMFCGASSQAIIVRNPFA